MRRVEDRRVVRLPDVAEQPDPYGWVVRMQALAELRALSEDPPEVEALPDRRSPNRTPGAAPHRGRGSLDLERKRGRSTDPDAGRSSESGPSRA